MIGVILCGGESTRMGTDKGLLKLHANTWAQTAVEKINVLQLPIVLSVNTLQYNDYASVFNAEQLIVDNNQFGVKGPLCGVLSVFAQQPLQDLFVLACDMPLMEPMLIKRLFHIYGQYISEYDAFVFTNNEQPEPLCGIYTAQALKHIITLLKANELKRHSMKFVLEHINTFFEPLTENEKKYFKNFNAHAELNGL